MFRVSLSNPWGIVLPDWDIRNCNSGGWVEFQDIDPLFTSQHESLSQFAAPKEEVIYPGAFLAQWMHKAGFINIRVVKINQPMTSRKDAMLVRRFHREQMLQSVDDDQLVEQQTDLSSETQYHEQLSTRLKSVANSSCWNRDQQNTFLDDLMSDEIHASPVSIDL